MYLYANLSASFNTFLHLPVSPRSYYSVIIKKNVGWAITIWLWCCLPLNLVRRSWAILVCFIIRTGIHLPMICSWQQSNSDSALDVWEADNCQGYSCGHKWLLFYYLTVDCKNQLKLSGSPKVITMFIYEESLFNNSNCCMGNHHDESFLFKLWRVVYMYS